MFIFIGWCVEQIKVYYSCGSCHNSLQSTPRLEMLTLCYLVSLYSSGITWGRHPMVHHEFAWNTV